MSSIDHQGTNSNNNSSVTTNKSIYSHSIKTIGDLLKDIELRHKVRDFILRAFNIENIFNIDESQIKNTEFREENDEFFRMMEELGLIVVDWNSVKDQEKFFGDRKLKIQFIGKNCKNFGERLYGKDASIDFDILNHIARKIGALVDRSDTEHLLLKNGVSVHMLDPHPEASAGDQIYFTFLAYSGLEDRKDKDKLLELIEKLADPIFLGIPDIELEKLRIEISEFLKPAELSIKDGHIHKFSKDDAEWIDEYRIDQDNAFDKPDNTKRTGLCPDLKWEDIEIKFNDGLAVTIKYGDKELKTDCARMGFEDQHTRLPNRQWKILRHMSEHQGFISFDEASKYTENIKSQQTRLRKKLELFFGIQGNSIKYRRAGYNKFEMQGYESIIHLLPVHETPSNFLRPVLG